MKVMGSMRQPFAVNDAMTARFLAVIVFVKIF